MAIVQEREQSLQTRAAVEHREKDDVMLNTFQMRSAIHVQRYRANTTPLDCDQAIQDGIQEELKVLKKAQEQKSKSKKGTPRTQTRCAAQAVPATSVQPPSALSHSITPSSS